METIDMDRLKTGEVNLGVRRRYYFLPPANGAQSDRSPYNQNVSQTSIMAVQFDGGVIVGADSRTTTGSYIVRRFIYVLTETESSLVKGQPRDRQTDLCP
jgi:hypothetical protein